MMEVIAGLIAPIVVMLFSIMVTERIITMFIRMVGFIEGLNQ